MMHIYVPSAGRADRVLTLMQIPDRWLERTHLVVPEDEVSDYAEHCVTRRSIEIMGCPRKGIHNTRQWILDNAHTNFAWMVDDDMKFQARKPDWKFKEGGYLPIEECDLDFVGKMLDQQEEWLFTWGLAAVSVSMRQMNHGIPDRWWREATRMNNVYGFRVDVLKEHGIRFDQIEVMEDFWVTLHLLTRGIPNRVSMHYVWNQRGSNNRGGCSEYRTPEVQARSARKLKEAFPEFVEVVEKTSSPGSDSWKKMKTRTDVKIAWRKAFSGKLRTDGSRK